MFKRIPILVLGASLIGAGAFAIFHSASPASARVDGSPVEPHAGLSAPGASTLPPGHPPIGAMNGSQGAAPPASDEPAALTWTVPAAWKTASNPSTMRLATYRIPRAEGDTADPELSVVRAGGGVEANIDRWLGQFDEAGKDTRTVKTIHGMPITIVEVHGTFLGGGMMGSAASPHPGWALLAAIVETPGSPYFFKMTGPAKSVTAAHPAFDALIAGVTPALP